MGKKTIYGIRGKPTSRICEEVLEKGIFDKVAYGGPKGQRGVFVEVKRGEFEALLNREGTPSADGYNATTSKSPDPNKDNPTRITYLSISRHGNTYKNYGTYDPQEMIRSPRHKFEKDAEKNTELKKFLEDILKYFNGI
jgi:hypothetical protein